MRPGGLFVDGDHLAEPAERPGLDALTRSVRAARVERAGTDVHEDWASWWDAVGDAPELSELTGERGARPIEHTVPDVPTIADHERLLRAAGFVEVGTVWQYGDDRVLVAVR